ncbi:MAG: nucleotidyltransferase domain-containing protein [Anaerolineae bacterium]|nr:nucleotidyltransferase domain-containing protein [Anaerolineae bacterium]
MSDRHQLDSRILADTIVHRYSGYEQVESVALGGSMASGTAGPGSDVDLYVYLTAELPVSARAEIAQQTASYAEVDNRFWEFGDEWLDTASGIHVDVTFRSLDWVASEIDRVLQRYEASVGYSTCIWHNVRSSIALFDRDGWYGRLQQKAGRPYPEELRRAIVAKNHPILRETVSSYRYQISGAVQRDDPVSVNHRVAALLASYFDILFAINRVPNPGEKRLIELAASQCSIIPSAMADQVLALVAAVPCGDVVLTCLDVLVDDLDAALRAEGLIDS